MLGITSLLIACKVEEIYYPKLSDFESITDGNNSVDDILTFERLIYLTLDWKMNPSMTTNGWANYFMMLWDQYADENPLGV